MAQQLKNTIHFSLAIGASVTVPHGLHDSEDDPLEPDIVFLPSEHLSVSTTLTDITITNDGPSPIEGDVLIEWWHTIERAFGDVANKNLSPKPYVVVSTEVGNAPPQPPFVPKTVITVFARKTGSDLTGDGKTPATAYKTFQRAIRDVPPVVPAYVVYVVDITGIGQETMPPDYAIPRFITNGMLDFDFSDPFFVWQAPVNIQADPEIVPLVPASDAVLAAPGDFVQSTDGTTGRITLVLTGPARPSWGVNLKGKVLVGSGPLDKARIVESTPNSLVIARSDGLPGSSGPLTTPLQIMQESAEFVPSGGNQHSFNGGFNLYEQGHLAIAGVAFGAVPDFPDFYPSVNVILGGSLVFEMCSFNGSHFLQGDHRLPVCWFKDSAFGTDANCSLFGVRECLVEESLFFLLSSTEDYLSVESTYLNTSPESTPYSPPIFSGPGAPTGGMAMVTLLRSCHFTGNGSLTPNGDTLVLRGGQAGIHSCLFAGSAGSAIRFDNGAGFMTLESVTGFGNAVGLTVNDGAVVRVLGANPNNPITGLLGAAGADLAVGNLPVIAWPGVAFNRIDLTVVPPALTDTLSRVFSA